MAPIQYKPSAPSTPASLSFCGGVNKQQYTFMKSTKSFYTKTRKPTTVNTIADWLPEDFIKKDLLQFRFVSDKRNLLERFLDHVAQKKQERLLDAFIYSSVNLDINDLFLHKKN